MSSIKGKADLWREGKDGASPGKRQKSPGGGEDFQAPANYRDQFKGASKLGGGGANAHASIDNLAVFANSIAGLGVHDKPFMPEPGDGRNGLDMYSVKSGEDSEFGMHMAKEGPKKHPGKF